MPHLEAAGVHATKASGWRNVPAENEGKREMLDQLFSVTYEELRRLASSVRRGDPSSTLSPTALVNEAWMKLIRSHELVPSSRLHFKRIAARAMRQLLVEAARRRRSGKRGGEGAVYVTLDESCVQTSSSGADVLALDVALRELTRLNPRQATLVEARFFGGFEVTEIAAMLGISEATALRDWRAAKAWLSQAVRGMA
jgi:RNA polymerase sigma factor (TIGR02999 family)